MSDSTIRQLERAAAGGDVEAVKRLGLEACRRGEHAPPHYGDDEWASVTRIATPWGTGKFCEWTCPRCWEQASATNPPWLDDNGRHALRIEAASRANAHAAACPVCRENSVRELEAMARAYPRDDYKGYKRVPCVEEQPGGVLAWRFDGTKEAARRRAAGEAP